MDNNSVTWTYKKFKSKLAARNFCISKKGADHISYLDGMVQSLYDRAKNEKQEVHGHGYPSEAASSIEAAYCSIEADRLRTLRKYFKGEPASLGYKWEYDNDRHEVHQHIDLTNVSPTHPVFLEYVKEQNLDIKDYDEAYELWLKCNTEGGMNNLFKLAYSFKMKNLIPDKVKLFGLIKKS
jgi:hypothetical protein